MTINKGPKGGYYTEQDVNALADYYLNHDVSDDDGEWMEAEVTKGANVVTPVLIKESNALYTTDEAINAEANELNLKALTIRISEEDLTMLKRLGKKIGLGHTQVARMIIHDSLSKRRR
ncbi:MAG TPA: hypothetical protein VGE40_07105 [Bacilli bacterium]